MVALGLLAAVGASVAFNVGIVLQAADARAEPAAEGLRLSLLAHLVRRRRWIAGLLLGGVGFGLQVLALALVPFVVVQPVLAIGLLLMLYLGVRMLGERVGVGEVAGVLGITAGIGLLAWGTPSGTEAVDSDAAVIAVMGTMALDRPGPVRPARPRSARLGDLRDRRLGARLRRLEHRHQAGLRRRRRRRLDPGRDLARGRRRRPG